MHLREDGTVVQTSWSSMHRRARVISEGLAELGVESSDRVVIMARTRVEWLWVDFALMFRRAMSVPVFPTERRAICHDVATDASPRVVVVENPLQLRKWLSPLGGTAEAEAETGSSRLLDGIAYAVVIDPECVDDAGEKLHLSAVAGPATPGVITLSALQGLGERRLAQQSYSGQTSDELPALNDVVTMTYTPGTEGEPKAVLLTHANFAAASAGLVDALDVGPEDLQLLYLPLAHAFGRVAVAFSVAAGVPIAFARSYRRLLEDARTFQPTFMCSVPRLFEKVLAEFQAEEEASTILHRAASRWALDPDDSAPGVLRGLKKMVAERLVSSRLWQVFGGRMRFAVSGAARLAPEVGRFFEARGIPILEGYGMTETAAVTHLNRLDNNEYGTVGHPLKGVRVRLGEDGEVLLAGGQISQGYWNRPTSASRIDEDGWLHTGDLGVLNEEGRLAITDRKRDIILTATGKVISPGPISEGLRQHPLVGQVLVHGEGRPFVTALLTLDREGVEKFARDAGLDLEYEELTRHPRVFATIEAAVDKLNETLAPHENVRKFALLDSELTPARGDLTPTQGVRRRVAAETHKALLDSFYSESY